MKAVVTLSKTFFSMHPRKGQETGFKDKVTDGRKVHTCRSNYEYWRAKIEKITATGGVLSVRQQPEDGVGAFRYYCCPEGLITETDLPEKWGLLWEKNGVITVVKDAERQQQNAQGEITILASIMRREGVKPRLFDYRKTKTEI